jgi:hypothetical protein
MLKSILEKVLKQVNVIHQVFLMKSWKSYVIESIIISVNIHQIFWFLMFQQKKFGVYLFRYRLQKFL